MSLEMALKEELKTVDLCISKANTSQWTKSLNLRKLKTWVTSHLEMVLLVVTLNNSSIQRLIWIMLGNLLRLLQWDLYLIIISTIQTINSHSKWCIIDSSSSNNTSNNRSRPWRMAKYSNSSNNLSKAEVCNTSSMIQEPNKTPTNIWCSSNSNLNHR